MPGMLLPRPLSIAPKSVLGKKQVCPWAASARLSACSLCDGQAVSFCTLDLGQHGILSGRGQAWSW